MKHKFILPMMLVVFCDPLRQLTDVRKHFGAATVLFDCADQVLLSCMPRDPLHYNHRKESVYHTCSKKRHLANFLFWTHTLQHTNI